MKQDMISLYNSFVNKILMISNKFIEKALEKKRFFGSFQFWSSILFILVFYFPSADSISKNAGFLYSGDIIGAWIPQIYNTYFLNNDFIFKGIDFLTQGGASEYFLRPNMITYNPLLLFLNYILDVSSVRDILTPIYILYVFHSFVACFFAQKLCLKFLKLDKYLSLFIGVSFAFSFFMMSSMGLMPFFLLACLTPVCIYGALCCYEKYNILNVFLSAFSLILVYTAGYLVLNIFIISVSFIFVNFYLYENKEFNFRNFLRIVSPFILSGLVMLPFYLSAFDFYSLTTPSGINSFEMVAHYYYTDPNILLRLFSNSINFPIGEMQSTVIGIIPMLIVLMFIFGFNDNIKKLIYKDKNLLIGAFGLFVVVLLSAMGKYSIFSALMFYIVPVFGKMHIYSRYLLGLSLFFFIGIGILLNAIIKDRNLILYKRFFSALLLLVMFLATLVYLGKSYKNLTDGYFIFEIVIAIIFIVFLILSENRKLIIFIAAASFFVISVNRMHSFSYQERYKNDKEIVVEQIHKNYQNTNDIVNYLSKNSSRDTKKVINILPEFSGSYITKNLPWLLRGKVNISSYYGYDPHLASEFNYRLVNQIQASDQEGYGLMFVPNVDWLKKTGAEFIIFKKDFKYTNDEIFKYVDLRNSFEIPERNIVFAKLNFKEPKDSVFNNGYVRVLSKDSSSTIKDFATNNANKMSFNINSSGISKVQYLFWPNKHMKPYIDGRKAKFKVMDGLYVLEVPAGSHEIEIVYKNILIDIFLFLYFGFFIVFALVVFYHFIPLSLMLAYKKTTLSSLILACIFLAIFGGYLQYKEKTKYDNIVLDFCGKDYPDSYVGGWSQFESIGDNCWCWAEQKSSSLKVKVDPKYNYKMIFSVGNHAMNKNQNIIINLGNVKIAEFPVLASEGRRFEVFLSKDLFNGDFANISFDFSENNSPNKSDKRKLALSFGKVELIKIEED